MRDFRNVVQNKKMVNARFARFNNIGTPRSGKSTFWKRLTGKDVDLTDGEEQNPSTGAAEHHSQIIFEDDLKDASVEMCVMPTEGNVWSELDHAKEVSMIKQIFADIVEDSSSDQDSSLPIASIAVSSPDTQVAESSSETVSNPNESDDSSDDSSNDSTVAETTLEHIFSILDKAQKTEDWDDSTIKYQLEKMILLSSTDTGGHAEFQDMHASLISGPSFNLLFHRLYDKLDEKFKVYFTKEDKLSTKAVMSDSTVKEIMFQALSSIACFGNFFADSSTSFESADISDVEKVLKSFQSKVMFVGTFLDKLTDKDEEFAEKDHELQDMVKNTSFEKEMICEAKDGQLMLAIGKGCGMDMDEIRRILRREVKNFCKPLPIPASWLVLSLCLRLHTSPTMSLADCKILAEKLEIDPAKELQFALWFLHHGVGVLHFYPEVPEVKDIVFCRAQVVYNCVTKIISAYGFEKVNKASADFRNTGNFSLKKIKEDEEYSTVPLRKFVKILEYLNIIAAKPPTADEVFFMPCVLETIRGDDLKLAQDRNPQDPPNLMLRYECGYTPVGVFPALITNLVSRQEELKWNMIEGKKAYKNKVHFRLRKSGDNVYLISHLQYFEIAFLRPSRLQFSNHPIESVCNHVRKVVSSALSDVILKMHYNFNMKYQFGFECSVHCDASDSHLALLDKELETLSYMECCEDEQQWPLEDKHRRWFGEAVSQGKYSCI